MNNASPPFQQVPLASFLGLYTEASPESLPEGVSPRNWDCDFVIGQVMMRPGLASAFAFSGSSTGPNNCLTGASGSGNLVPWANPGNITVLDSNYATATVGGSGTSASYASSASGLNWSDPSNATGSPDGSYAIAAVPIYGGATNPLILAGYGFSLPVGSAITGVQASITGLQTRLAPVFYTQATLYYNGNPIGTTKIDSLDASSGTLILGGSTDLWGAALTYSMVNSGTFGIGIVGNHASGPPQIISIEIDAVQLQIFYNYETTNNLLASNFNFSLPSVPVQGITIGVTGYQTGTVTLYAQLMYFGVAVGQVRSVVLNNSQSRVTLGGMTDNWGANLISSNLNGPNFVVALWASGDSSSSFYIDLVDCTVSQTTGSQNFNWVKTYAQTSGQVDTLALDNSGTLWQEDVTSDQGMVSSIFSAIQAGSFAKSITLDNVEYIAFSDLQEGLDIPRQWNGTNLDRVSQVGPGAAPSVNFTTNGVSIVASPNGITQAAAISLPTAGNGTWALWSDAPQSYNIGNVLTVIFPSSYHLPAGFINGAYVSIKNFPSMGGFDPNSGATNGSITNPSSYQIFNVGGPIQGQSAYSGFSVQLLQSGFYNQRVSGGSETLQLTLATLTATAQVPNLQVGSQFVIAAAGDSGWDGSWTVQETPNASQLLITNTLISGNIATYSYVLVSGSTPTPGQQVQITGCVNGNGVFNGNKVIATATSSQFTVSINSPDVSSAAESGQGIVNGTIFEFEPQKIVSNSGGGTISTTGYIGAGSRACVVCFLTRNGYITAPSPYIQFSTTGGADSLTISNIPVGPPDVIARIIAFTGAQVTQIPGQIGNFFWIPEPVTVFDATAGQDVTYTATIIHDNTSTQATFTFTDAILLASLGIDIQGNNLFAQKELGPSLGCISYAGRMFYWGELNKVTNFLNMSFDGGAGINSSIGSGGTGGSATYPLGWTPSDTLGSVIVSAISGNSYYIKQTGTSTPIGMITQPASVDQYGVNILNPQVTYSVRVQARTPYGIGSGNLRIDLYSPSFDRVYGFAKFPLSTLGTSFGIHTLPLLTTPFTVQVVNDLQLRVYGDSLVTNSDIEIDRIEVFPTIQPVLTTQLTASYVNNFEAFDQITGIVDSSIQNQQPVRSCFVLGDTLYMVKSGSLVATQDNGLTEPYKWKVRTISNSVGSPSSNGVDFVDNQDQGESYALIAGRTGLYIFNGGEPSCLSGDIRSLWNLINWQYGHTLWVRNDQVNRRIYVGVPLATPNQWLPNAPSNPNPTTPNVVLMMSYREVNTVSQLIEHATIRASSFTGRLIATDISRKWSIWNIQAPYADFVTRNNGDAPLFLGNSVGIGKVYQLTEGQTDDDGAAINQLYTTYGFIKSDLAQAIGVGSVRRLFGYMTMIVQGNGSLGITAYPDNLNTPYADVLTPLSLPPPNTQDAELPLNETGSRLFLQFSTNAVGEYFTLSQIVMCLQRDPFAPVRGF